MTEEQKAVYKKFTENFVHFLFTGDCPLETTEIVASMATGSLLAAMLDKAPDDTDGVTREFVTEILKSTINQYYGEPVHANSN